MSPSVYGQITIFQKTKHCRAIPRPDLERDHECCYFWEIHKNGSVLKTQPCRAILRADLQRAWGKRLLFDNLSPGGNIFWSILLCSHRVCTLWTRDKCPARCTCFFFEMTLDILDQIPCANLPGTHRQVFGEISPCICRQSQLHLTILDSSRQFSTVINNIIFMHWGYLQHIYGL